ncbi:zinc finger, CCHC-type containing protein [Tanacetum coccineum]
MAEDTSSKKSLVSNFNNYMMVDSRMMHLLGGLTQVQLVMHVRIVAGLRLFIWAVVRLSEPKRKKLGEKGIISIFIGYVEHSKAYRFYVIEPNEYISVNSVIESRDAMFDEKQFTSIPRPKSLMPSSNEDQIGETSIENPTTRRSNRARVAKSFGSDFQLYLVEGSRDEIGPQYSYSINDEMDSIMGNNTWILSDLPPGCKPLGCKWIFKRKIKINGTIDKFKDRLVIQGFRQKKRIDYFDTYAHVDRISTISLLIALAATYNLVIHQMNVKITFLNDDLEEEVYMKQHEGFIMPEMSIRIDQGQVDKTKEFLSSNFSMKDMGEAGVILGIRIKREDKGITITQSHYIEKILKKFKCDDCCPVSTPLDPTIKLMPNTGKAVDQLEYSRAIGCLMYAMTSTRPDIAYDVGKLNRYTSNPSTHHWHDIMRVFKYLKKTMDYGLSYVGFLLGLEGYSDASWITNSKDHTSTTGWVFLLGGGAISWASKKQTRITDSTMEVEFVTLAATGKEAEWLRNLIYEISLWPKRISPISIHSDSAATLAKAYCQIYNEKSRHLGVRHSMVCELITNGVISLDFVRSQQNMADHFTKGLARDLVHKSAIRMGLKSIEISNDETPNSLPANVGG